MIPVFNSTQSFYESTRSAVLRMQRQLVIAQKELSSGRLADPGVTLGSEVRRTVSMRIDVSRMTQITDTNATVATRLESSQSAISSLTDMAQTFLSTLLTARDTSTGPATAEQEAKANLATLTGALNTTVGGEYMFSGIDTDAKPLTNYYETPTPANKTAVDNAFLAAFGTTQSADNSGIDSTTMQTFLDNDLAPQFEEPAWSANWSDASDQNIKSRIAPRELMETSSNANLAAYRKLAHAFTMIGELGVQNLNQGTFQTVVDQAVTLTNEAIQGLAVEAGRLGTAQERISKANDRMSAQISILNTQIDNLEVVDPYDAATRVNTLMTQLETAYALTNRIQNMKLVNYLS
jgi:flagellar hook-associated protein 3 FlgL